MLVNTPSKTILQRQSGGQRSITMTTPEPQNSGLQTWGGVPLTEWKTISCSHLHLIKAFKQGV